MARSQQRKKSPAGLILLGVIIVAAAAVLGVFFGGRTTAPPPAGTEEVSAEPDTGTGPAPLETKVEPEPAPAPPDDLPPAQTITLECVADNSIISYPKETLFNHGAKSSLRIKGIDHLGAFKFNTSPVKGMVVEKAVLRLTVTNEDLIWAGVSTIARDWVEGKGTRYAVDEEGNGSCFLFASWAPVPMQAEPWGRFPIDVFTPEMMKDPDKAMGLPLPREDFTDVSFFPGRCVFANFVKARRVDEKVRELDVPPRAVEMMAAGLAYGLAVHDGTGETGWNTAVASRESNTPPELVVTGRVWDKTPPAAPVVTAKAPGPNKVEFTVRNPRDDSGNLAYLVTNGKGEEIARNRINGLPDEQGGTTEFFLYEVPAGDNSFEIAVMDRAGNIGPGATVSVTVSGEPQYDLFDGLQAVPSSFAEAPAEARDGGILVWAVPDTAQVDPVEGGTFHRGDDRKGNEIWDASARNVSLASARNEVVAFQLVLEPSTGRAEDLKIQTSALSGPGEIAASNISLYRTWYVKCPDDRYHPSPCVPVDGPFDIPWQKNSVPGQKNQSIVVDIQVPKDAAAGGYTGKLSVEGNGVSTDVTISLTVWPFALPDLPTYVLELNAYSGIGKGLGVERDSNEYEKVELLYHQLGHAHRQTVNVLPYSQSGNLGSRYYVPEMQGGGADISVASWGRWDERFGKYFDGRAFTSAYGYEGLWQGAPVTHFYLPFHENWPAPIDQYYKVDVATTKYPELIIEHARKAPHISEAFEQPYIDAFKSVARQYADHIAEKGWDKTSFHFYLNNKHYWKKERGGGRPGTGTSWWLLDEPRNAPDFEALKWYGQVFWDAVGPEGRKYIDYRIDLSRPQWQHDTLDGLATLMVVSGAFYPKHYVVENRIDRLGETYWHYGGGHEIGGDNLNLRALVYKDWSMGADGGLPYYTSFRGNSAWDKGDRLGLVLPGSPVDIKGPVGTLRLKVLRRAQQDIEYLNLAAGKYGRGRVAGSLAKAINLSAEVESRHADDPGRASFEGLSEATFEAVRRRLAQLLK